ncbi:hypothetical protein HUT06_31375 [Actinomadura sp. NAK00032]|uniref:hypothetical protein n=1 Tax=Actinomadura sp. NAK00032 TaxID=2742128 RepID=UPI0015928D69|nr:hypothetical protein [Actinomadura sp. NAK00032]QKW37953.1 hypothetical protein HUT06_31375 [Actinomadura sp. NAK00032]
MDVASLDETADHQGPCADAAVGQARVLGDGIAAEGGRGDGQAAEHRHRHDRAEAAGEQRRARPAEVAERSLADLDPWNGFVAYVEGLFELQARDRGLNDVRARRLPDDQAVEQEAG